MIIELKGHKCKKAMEILQKECELNRALLDLLESIGLPHEAKGYSGIAGSFAGVRSDAAEIFCKARPSEWLFDQKKCVWRPRGNTPEGRALKKRFDKLEQLRIDKALGDLVGFDPFGMKVFKFFNLGWVKYRERFFLMVSDDAAENFSDLSETEITSPLEFAEIKKKARAEG